MSVVISLVCCAQRNASETHVFFSEKVNMANKIATFLFYMQKDIMKIIFFSPAENIESLLRVNMNIAYKGSIVHFFET